MASTAFGLVFTLIVLQPSMSILTVVAGEMWHIRTVLNMKIGNFNY